MNGFIRWLSQGYKALKENIWLLAIISAIGIYGLNMMRAEMRRQVDPLVDMVRWDFEETGKWPKYLAHKAKIDSQTKAFEPSPSASAGYPMFQYGGR